MNKPLFVAARALGVAATIAVAVGVSSCGGTGAEGGCPATASCGGDLTKPTGFWQVETVCQYFPTQPSQPLTYNEYVARPPDPVLTPVQPLPTTGGDWCSALDYNAGGVQEVILWHPAAKLTSGNVSFNSDATYESDLQFSAQASTNFPVACLQSGGVAPTCSQFETDLTAFYAMAPNAGQGIVDIHCTDDVDSSCTCNYTFQVALVDKGTYSAADGILYENTEEYTYNGVAVTEYQPSVPTAISYCDNGGLTLTGNDGANLSGVVGLRTLTLQSAKAPPAPADGGM